MLRTAVKWVSDPNNPQPAVLGAGGVSLELTGHGGQRLLALSERAAASLTAAQKAVIERSATLLPLRVPTIELAGGSVRCMLAGIHLARRPSVPAQAMAGRDHVLDCAV